ncbi:structural maintenance of chromosome (RecF/RecN/SMC) N terminal domain family protein [Babesia bovis T2Bo]|uniref:structural maintenance of chromosome (RecF/RecN/SMC) N terminal domain family protein n=1 Tax=Babesia bovis T2Bo TaxID=484906 RepID=UPI001C3537B7|nr:structural maintenance of chromosome (RecF/RecN/SMC) N terminal domain family protein [Babesia bovis T2Bo]EDO07856.2 structural maintenance of chromosome (RecF/RecN/SMC) N terminal domain family protein [Babesia bovis T2Bo]
MYIKEVNLCGFRTYRDQCSFQFSKGYNVIVGQNGSGKSNVLLAVSFALAENLEQTNREYYLYRGIESSEDEEYTANVEVIFDISSDSRARSVVDDDGELRLKRIFSRSKDLYLVNGRQMSRKDYRQLLESVNLIPFSKQSASYRNDLHFIVKQGAVGKLCNLTSEERLLAFRDVIGHRSFDSKIDESLKLLQDYDVTSSSVDTQLSQIERKLESLAIQREATEEWSVLDAERRVLNARLLLHKVAQLREDLQAKISLEFSHTEAIGTLQTRIDLLGMDIKEARNALSIVESMDTSRVTESEISGLSATIADVESDISSVRNEINVLVHTKGELEHEMSSLTQHIDESSVSLSDTERNCSDISQRIQEIETELSEVLHRQRNPGEKIQDMIDRLEHKKVDAYASIKEIDSQQLVLSNSLTRCNLDLERVQAELRQLDALYISKSETVQQCSEELEVLVEQRRVKQHELSVNNMKLSTLRVQYGDAEKSFSKVALSHNSTLSMVKDWLASDSSAAHRSDYVGFLLDLLTIPDAFRVAIEQTLGTKLFTIIVRTMACARSLMSYVEGAGTHYGNIRIVPLDMLAATGTDRGKASGIDLNRDEAMPLIECVRYDDLIQPALRSLLGSFCLVENAEVAGRILPMQVNCVTPDGQVFYHRGSVSGGYIDLTESVLSLYSTMKSRDSELRKLCEYVTTLTTELASLDTQQAALSQKHNAAKAARQDVQAKLRQMQITAQHLKSQEEVIRQKLSDNTKERLLQQIKSWDEQIAVFERSLTPSPAEVAALAERQAVLESDLSRLRGEKLGYEARFHGLKDSISELCNKRNTVAKRIITTMQMLEEYENHVAELGSKLKQLRQNRDSMDTELVESYQELDSIRQRRDELCSRLHQLDTELVSKKADLSDVTSRLHETTQAVSTLRVSLKDSEEELSKVDPAVIREAESVPIKDKEHVISRLSELNKRCAKFDLSSHGAEDEYAALRAEFTGLKDRQERMTRSHAAILKSIQALKSQKDANLVQMLSQLNQKLSATFAELVTGGRLQAVLIRRDASVGDISSSVAVCLPECFVDSPDEETFTGLDLQVSFSPDAERMQLYQLSGGQKTLVSLAFILAAQRLHTAPFYLLDEIDAALDDNYRLNVSQLLSRQCNEGSQCILTTFRPELLRPGEVFYEVCNSGGTSTARRVSMREAISVINKCPLALTNGRS